MRARNLSLKYIIFFLNQVSKISPVFSFKLHRSKFTNWKKNPVHWEWQKFKFRLIEAIDPWHKAAEISPIFKEKVCEKIRLEWKRFINDFWPLQCLSWLWCQWLPQKLSPIHLTTFSYLQLDEQLFKNMKRNKIPSMQLSEDRLD